MDVFFVNMDNFHEILLTTKSDGDILLHKGVSNMIELYHDGSRDLPYKAVPDEYITVSYCDINDHRPPHQYYDTQITERKNGRADYYLLFIINGCMTATIDGREQKALAGDMIIYYPNIPQKIIKKRVDSPVNYWVHFNGYAIPEILTQCGITKSGVYTVGNIDVISDIFRQMILAQRLSHNSIHKNALFLQLMSKICIKDETMLPATPTNSVHADKVVQGIIQMEWEYQRPRSISEYAKLCNMSPGRFSTIFKKATGKAPQKFIEDIRISKARELLSGSALSVSQISANVGFRDPLYFSRVFKNNVGVSPTEYRHGITKREQCEEPNP